jgi:hypothetical protein
VQKAVLRGKPLQLGVTVHYCTTMISKPCLCFNDVCRISRRVPKRFTCGQHRSHASDSCRQCAPRLRNGSRLDEVQIEHPLQVASVQTAPTNYCHLFVSLFWSQCRCKTVLSRSKLLMIISRKQHSRLTAPWLTGLKLETSPPLYTSGKSGSLHAGSTEVVCPVRQLNERKHPQTAAGAVVAAVAGLHCSSAHLSCVEDPTMVLCTCAGATRPPYCKPSALHSRTTPLQK